MSGRVIYLFIAVVVALLLAGCASTSNRESAGEYFDSASITTRIKAAYVKDPNLKVFQIEVDTFKRVVQLSGFVDSQEMVDRAVDIARRTGGVKSVQNSLVIKSAVAE